MIQRLAGKKVISLLAHSPSVAIIGPRQCGKTTLAQSLGGLYFDLEQSMDRVRVDTEWNEVVASQKLVILDEAQSYPELFPRLRGAIDSDRKRNGRFLLLGSVSPALMTQVGDSLAGRLSICELTPLLATEIHADQLDQLWKVGGFPDGGIINPIRFPVWQSDYLALLTQRDLPNWGMPAKPQTTQRLLKMVAAIHGQTWNASQIGQSMGLDYKTINSYVDFLENAFLLRKLQPFHANIGKRLIKSPKVYWRDTGLLHNLLNLTDPSSLTSQPWVGASWEGFVIEQLISSLQTDQRLFNACYFRTSDQHEIDLVIEQGQRRTAIEIKLTTSPSPADMSRLNHAANLIDASHRILISRTRDVARSDRVLSCDLLGAIQELVSAAS